MKKILITGANSYIGTSFEKYMAQFGDEYQIDTVDMIDGAWRDKDFSGYDSVFHVAGIAHSDNGKISKEKEKLYYAVNTDLTVETAKKAKADGVKQFIFMSSAIVYGNSAPIGKGKRITKDTPVRPANCYGDSKVQAENGLGPLSDDNFKVVIFSCVALCVSILSYIVQGNMYKKRFCIQIVESTLLIAISSFMWFSEDALTMYVPRGEVISQLEAYIDVGSKDIEDENFWRMDKNECVDELSCNLPFWFGYNGVSSFNNTVNPRTLEYYRVMENPGLAQANKVYDYDRRFTDEYLSAAKYFVAVKDNTIAPFEYKKIKETPNYDLFQSDFETAIAYTYSSFLSKKEFLDLDIAKKQEVMLKSVVREKENDEIRLDLLDSEKLVYNITSTNGISISEEQYLTEFSDSTLTLTTFVPEMCELFVEFNGLTNEGDRTCGIVVYSDTGIYNDCNVPVVNAPRSTLQSDLCINLGSGIAPGNHQFTIAFSQGLLRYDSLNLYARSLSKIENDIKELNCNECYNTQIDTNRIEFDMDLSKDAFVLISQPFSKGWRCFVDGKKVNIEAANIMYIGLECIEGRHHFKLVYFPYGMRIGMIISFISILFVIREILEGNKNNDK